MTQHGVSTSWTDRFEVQDVLNSESKWSALIRISIINQGLKIPSRACFSPFVSSLWRQSPASDSTVEAAYSVNASRADVPLSWQQAPSSTSRRRRQHATSRRQRAAISSPKCRTSHRAQRPRRRCSSSYTNSFTAPPGASPSSSTSSRTPSRRRPAPASHHREHPRRHCRGGPRSTRRQHTGRTSRHRRPREQSEFVRREREQQQQQQQHDPAGPDPPPPVGGPGGGDGRVQHVRPDRRARSQYAAGVWSVVVVCGGGNGESQPQQQSQQ